MLCFPCFATEYTVYYPKDFKPINCLAWKETGYGTCDFIISCYGNQNGGTQYYTQASCRVVELPLKIKYKASNVKDRIYLDKSK